MDVLMGNYHAKYFGVGAFVTVKTTTLGGGPKEKTEHLYKNKNTGYSNPNTLPKWRDYFQPKFHDKDEHGWFWDKENPVANEWLTERFWNQPGKMPTGNPF